MEKKTDKPQILGGNRTVCQRMHRCIRWHAEKAEVVSGLIMQGAAVVAYIIGEGLADAAAADGVTIIHHSDKE